MAWSVRRKPTRRNIGGRFLREPPFPYLANARYTPPMAATLLLDRDSWDLCLDALGNIAVASEPYAVAQDAASACRVFYGEAYYDTSLGVPYFDQVFSGATPVAVLKQRMASEAKRVPDVTAARVTIGSLAGRKLAGQVQVTLADGSTQSLTL